MKPLKKKISRNEQPTPAGDEPSASTPLASSEQEVPATMTASTGSEETSESLQAQPASGELSKPELRALDVAEPKTGLRLDGPTLEEWVKAGYPAEKYPPPGYAAKPAGLASTFRSELPGGGFRPPPSAGNPSTCRSEANHE